jgi:tetratricopeptide (TPR) repeat protein
MLSRDEIIETIEGIGRNKSNLRRLVEQLETPLGVIPFVGAGLSVPSGFPGWTRFLLSQAKDAEIEDEIQKLIDDGKYEEAAERLLEELGDRDFSDAIEGKFGDHNLEGKELAGAASVLPKLAAGPVITTNFDHVLERAFENAGCRFKRPVWGVESDMFARAYRQNCRLLLKIHGDYMDRTDRILTKTDYEKHYGSSDASDIDWERPLPRLLDQTLKSRVVLFLGCSLNQDRTVAILGEMARRAPGIFHYAVVEMPDCDEEYHRKQCHLSDHGIRPIWYPAGRHELVEPLLEYLVEQIPTQYRPGRQLVLQRRNRPLSGPDDVLLEHGRSGFYGRGAESDRVVEFLMSGASIGTVTASADVYNVEGAAGIGKTEVCKEALKKYLAADPGEKAYYVELAGAQSEAGFITRLAEAFEVSQAAGRDEVLREARAEPGVIYVDNLEDVLDDQGAVDLLIQLAGIPGARVLASSREALPGIGFNIPIESLDVDPAVELFLVGWERSGAKALLGDSDELREFLVRDLGCHPLSIVLVSAQGYQCGSLEALRDRWREESMKLARLPRVPENPLTSLEVSISRSFDAVLREMPEALKLWGMMGMFPEGMSLSAWEMLKEGIEKADDARELLIRLNVVDVDSQDALQMLPSLRQFILHKAEKGENGLSREMLAEMAYPYFYRVARTAHEHEFDDERTVTLDAVLAEFPNLHHFVLFAASLGNDWPRMLSDLSFCLRNFYQYRSLLGVEMLRRLLDIQKSAGFTLEVANSSMYLGDLESLLGRLDEAQEHYGEAIRLYRQERSNLGLANAMRSLGDLEHHLGKLDEAQEHYNEAIELYRQVRDNLGLANAILSFGDLERDLGKLDEAQEHYQQAIELYRQERDNLGLAGAILSLGDLERHLDQLDEAQEHYQQAIELYRQERDNLGLANAIQFLGHLERERREFEKAKALYEKARELYIDVRHSMGLAYTCAELARVSHYLGEKDDCDRFLKEAFAAAEASHVPGAVKYVEDVQRVATGFWKRLLRRWATFLTRSSM